MRPSLILRGNASSASHPASPRMARQFNEKSIVHMFLPKQTPDTAEDDHQELEEDMLIQVNNSFEEAMTSSNMTQLAPVKIMLDKWIHVQPKCNVRENPVEVIKSEFEDLDVGSTIPIYIRQQNCTMLVSKCLVEDEGKVRVQTFRASLPSAMVMTSVDALEMKFPETSNLIENEGMLSSKIFASHIYELATEDFGTPAKIGISRSDEFRDVPDPSLVFELMVGLLVPTEDKNGFSITKKIRDQVNVGSISPSRRSGMWMSIKVALHLKILEIYGGDMDTAKLVYKIAMLKILVDACKSHRKQSDAFELDLSHQMRAKIGRRVVKLQELNCGECDVMISTQVELMRSFVLEYASEVITALHGTAKALWLKTALPTGTRTKKLQPIGRSTWSFTRDLLHTIDPLDDVVDEARKLIGTPARIGKLNIDTIRRKSVDSLAKLRKRRFTTMNSIVKAAHDNDQFSLWIWLHDTEQFIKGIRDEHEFTPKQIFDLGQLYIPKARGAYKENPIGFSQMMLVSLKLTYILDKIATRRHPILLEYTLDIRASSFDCLLLPFEDVKLLDDILDYFNFRAAKGKSSFLERQVNENSLPVRYAEVNQEMRMLKERLYEIIARDTRYKIEEVERARQECQDLERRMNDLGGHCSCRHEWQDEEYWTGFKFETRSKYVQVYYCEYCPLKRTFDWKRKSVGVYEAPLPPNSQGHLQNAVIFELLIPEEISYLRQFLAILKFELLEEASFTDMISINWLEYSALGCFTSRRTNIISLGSTCIRTNPKNPDLLYNDNASFIRYNDMNCVYHYYKAREAVKNLRKKCTFQLIKTFDGELYQSLQKYLNWTEHSQNEVYANQSDCHQRLSLEEFKSFGSLRAGHRIQLRQLFRAISDRSLTLEKEPVLALVLQSIWQVGSRDEHGRREAHLDFQEDAFALQFLELLENLVKSHESNYSSPLVLLTAIFITGRIMELNETCRGKCYQLFKEWRELTKVWCSKLEADLGTYGDKDMTKIAENKIKMQMTLHLIKTCSMMTFNVCSPDLMGYICKANGDMAHLLHTITSKNLLGKESNPEFSGFMEILRFVEQMIPVRLKLDRNVTMGRKPKGRGGVARFIEEKFPNARDYGEYQVLKLKGVDNIILVQFSTDHCIAFDILTGELLINGYPETELSSQINRNLEFRRFFRKYLNFRVQRLSSSVLRTSEPFHGKHYEFRIRIPSEEEGDHFPRHVSRNELDIIEIEGKDQLILVPHQKFRGFISDHFIDNYIHWLDVSDPLKDSIYFRRIARNDTDYDLSHEFVMTRKKEKGCTNKGWMFQDVIKQQFLVSIKSEGYTLLTKALSRLELAKYINVFMDSEMTTVGAHLPRHNLRFILRSNELLESLEYPGFQVLLDQESGGTFVGLKNSLLLGNGVKRSIIVPNGKIRMSCEKGLNAHQICRIDREALLHPPFYVFDFDDVLERLVAVERVSAWLYLAALHAITSSSQPDPFTGMTGTEMAVNILKSAIVWSCSPYDKESLEILKFIQNLSPRRNYAAGNSAETVIWPLGIPTMAAYDGYAILVNDLILKSLQLVKLHTVDVNQVKLYSELAKHDSSEKLRLRAYLRNVDKYNDAVRLDERVVKELELKYKTNECHLSSGTEKMLAPMMITAWLRHLCDISLPLALDAMKLDKGTLTPFLLRNQPILPKAKRNLSTTLRNLLRLEFRSCWLMYYHLAISKSEIGHHEFNVLLSALAYRGAPLEQIHILHCIRTVVDSDLVDIRFPPVPQLPTVEDPTENEFNEILITGILKQYSKQFSKPRASFRSYDEFESEKRAHELQIDRDCGWIAQTWKSMFWPCEQILRDYQGAIFSNTIACPSTALCEVNKKIRVWYYARELKCFVEAVQVKVNECVDVISTITLDGEPPQLRPPISTTVCTRIRPQKSDASSLSIVDLMELDGGYDDNNLLASEASGIFETGRFGGSKDACELKIKTIKDKILQIISTTVDYQILHLSGLSPRLNPMSLLKIVQRPDLNGHTLQHFVGALAVLWTHLKRFNRYLHLQQAEVDFQSQGHENWSPMEYPEWLLLELELDIMIREVQVEVALQMINMPDGGNGVMQLNMGQGKTSVILPMLCAVLAKEDSLCRVTVLSALFNMNWASLKFAIAGLLNQRLYSFPCRRDMKIDEACIRNIQVSYKECMEMKGVVLTLPEYRLSFRLLAYDNILKGETSAALGLKLLQVENWLRYYARDVLDESDELLRAKYQLVYTIGEQIQVGGGEVRWTVCQQILDIVQDIIPKLMKTYGPTLVEHDNSKATQSPHEFQSVRLLGENENEEFFEKFEQLVVNTYLAGVTLPETQMNLVADFLLKKDISLESHENAMTLLKKDPALLDKILTLAGYIRRGVLVMALSKRWRVEYGVDQKAFRRMAVPFRAKDVAAESTEFGHPDLAIILTHLTYYYSGLSDEELEEVFTILKRKRDRDALYSQWIQHIPDGLVPSSLADYHFLNLEDAFQKSSLFDLVRKHKMVIDFWLSHAVFPKESKQFPGKLVMTAWDLIYERHRLSTSGFSGTNDSTVLLPLMINQQDLPQLQGTNEEMEEILLRPENSGHRSMAMGVTCEDILRAMKEDQLRILIDSGALMLELDNEQVAELWLEIDSNIEAVIYFNKDNERTVKSRSSGLEKDNRRRGNHSKLKSSSHQAPDVRFEESPFKGKLECCGVFLDDQHTRGTDIKFPVGSKACVTIGRGMKRDKLLQACMRMRRLGKGHAVTFYVSHEARNKIMNVTGADMLSTLAVLEWVKWNTKTSNEDGLLHWAIAAKNYAQRLVAEDNFHFPNCKDPINASGFDIVKANILADQCVDQEVTALVDMYGQHSKLELMTDLVLKWFNLAKQKLIRSSPPPPEVMLRFDEIMVAVFQRCQKYVPEKCLLSSSTTMDEEQEKELELELEKETEVEEERQEERPCKVDPAKPYLHPIVARMVIDGGPFGVVSGVIVRLSDIFMNASFANEMQPDDWKVEVYVTGDFISVISPTYGFDKNKADLYLRPMEHFVSNKLQDGTVQILFLSPHEANELIPLIGNHETKCPLHMFSPKKFETQDMLLNSPRLQLPPSISADEKFRVLKSGTREMAALLLASGSPYFNNHQEQRSYAAFLCLAAKPWTQKYRELFESGMITSSGFLLPEFRQEQNYIPLGFRTDPMGLVKKILRCRNPRVSDVSHVMRLLDDKTYVRLRNDDT